MVVLAAPAATCIAVHPFIIVSWHLAIHEGTAFVCGWFVSFHIYIYSPILSHKMDVPVIHFLHDDMLLQQQPGVGCLVLRVNVDVIEMKTILFV